MGALGSLFDGSGGFPLAGALSGITPLWASEIEPYPIAVTTSRFPQMKHLGNVAEVDGRKIPPVDVITFGSPCQDMSVAGKRAGMKHAEKGDDATTRSGLFYEAIRIIREMREATHGKYPAFAIWENVPGAFSSNKGEDFRYVLEEFAKICEGGCSIPRPAGGKWNHAGEIVGNGFSVAWRLCDAQYWGVPQRRKRIYLVADFAGGRAGKILFERESVQGHSAPGRETRQAITTNVARSAGGSNHSRDGSNVIYALHDKATRCRGGGATRHDDGAGNGLGVTRDDLMYTLDTAARHAVCFKPGQGAKARSMGESETTAPTLASEAGGNAVPGICYPSIFHTLTAQNARNPESAQQPNCICYPQVARTLTAEADASPCIDRGQNVVCVQNTGHGWWNQGDIAETLRTPAGGDSTKANLVVVCYDARGNGDGTTHCPTLTGDHENRVTDYTAICVMAHGQSNAEIMQNLCPTLNCNHEQPIAAYGGKPPRKYIIRRLTPLECCRLQGFPDGWGAPDYKENMTDEELAFWQKVRDTHAAVNGKPTKAYTAAAMVKWYNSLHTDSAEYKMWGNGIALPNAAYVLAGIADALANTVVEQA